jgi:hypothetical protein
MYLSLECLVDVRIDRQELSGQPDWDFMLGDDIDVLSLDVYNNTEPHFSTPEGLAGAPGQGSRFTNC